MPLILENYLSSDSAGALKLGFPLKGYLRCFSYVYVTESSNSHSCKYRRKQKI